VIISWIFNRRIYLIALVLSYMQSAAQEIQYDPEKGIIILDKNKREKPLVNKSESSNKDQPKKETSATKTISRTPVDSTDIQVGRKKDPPELYYRSGLEYFKNGNYSYALKNFKHADSLSDSMYYRLWIGKTYRQLGDSANMLSVLESIINGPENDVADDALFEIAHYYQQNNDYEKASQAYTQLIEQYPFGTSFSTGEELREIAREQRRFMRAEMLNILSILGYKGEDLPSSYRLFQKANHLQETGTGDAQTISTIKSKHNEYLLREQKNATQDANAEKYLLVSEIAGAIGLINCVVLLILRANIKRRKNQVSELQKTLNDLDVKKL
jgi:tetratricopeptide (TPR) repeat protein